MLDGRDDDAETIEELIDPVGLSTALLQGNFVLLSRLLARIPEEEVADGLTVEKLRSEGLESSSRRVLTADDIGASRGRLAKC